MTTTTIVLSDDVDVKQNAPTTNYDTQGFIAMQSATVAGYGWRALWKGSLAGIPLGAIINEAKLYIDYFYYPSETYNPKGRACKLLRNVTDFVENIVTWNTKPDTTTEGEVSVNHPANYGWWAINITAFIQAMVNEEYPNYGFTLKFDNEVGGYAQAQYYDHENANPDLRPYLYIDYTVVAEYHVTGVTRDANGNPLGGCTVWLFETATKEYKGETISNDEGVYDFIVIDDETEHFIRAYKDDTPNIFGTSDRNLKGVET